MSPRTGRFQRADRLRRSAEFQRVTRRGRRVAGGGFVVISLAQRIPGDPTAPRLGITVSRKVGHAVIRNRVKRQVREWFRSERSSLANVGDLVVIGRRAAADLSHQELWSELRELTGRLARHTPRGEGA